MSEESPVKLPEISNFHLSHNILEALEEDMGIQLDDSKKIPEDEQKELRRYCNLASSKINRVFGEEQGYIRPADQEWLTEVAENPVLLTANEFGSFLRTVIELSPGESLSENGVDELIAIAWSPSRAGKETNRFIIFNRQMILDFPDKQALYWISAVEELLHVSIRMDLGGSVERSRINIHLVEASAKRYALEVLPDPSRQILEDADHRLIEDWRILEQEFGEEALKKYYFSGDSESVDIDKLYSRAAELIRGDHLPSRRMVNKIAKLMTQSRRRYFNSGRT